MKKIFLSICLLVTAATVYAQHPIGNDSFALQTLGSSATFVKSKGAIGSDSGFVNAAYADTTAANRGNKLKNYPGALIRVVNDLWMRNTTATAWIKINGTSGGGGIGAVYAGNCLIQVDDSTLAFDPTCAGVDSIYLHSSVTADTILYDKNGTQYIAGWIDKGGILNDVTGTDNYGFHPIVSSPTTDTRDIQVSTLLTKNSIPFIGTDGAIRENNSKFYFDSAAIRMGLGTNALDATLSIRGAPNFGSDTLLTAYARDSLRTALFDIGTQRWWLTGSAGEVGSIYFSEPLAHPGVLFYNNLGTARTQWRQYTDTGGQSWGSLSSALIPNNSMVLLNNGHLFLTGFINPATVAPNEQFVTDNGYMFNVTGNTFLDGTLNIESTATGSAGTDSILVESNGLVKKISPSYYGTGSGSGTVTSVATNTGSGITGGTITTTGTLAIDTTIVSTKANVNSKTVTLNNGYGLSIPQTATQNLGTPPSWTPAVDTSLISTKANVNSKTVTINAGAGISIAQTATQNLNAPPSWTIVATGLSQDTVNVSNVLSYGADSTGVVDATSAFNAAIANALLAPIGKRRVYVPHGTYLITNAVLKASSQTNKKGVELQNGIELYGDGRYTIIKAANHTTGDTSNTNWYPLINGQYMSNCYIHDITLDGNKANQNVYNANPYVNPSGHNDTSAHYNENGIYFRNGNNDRIDRVYVHDAAGFDIEFYNCSNAYTGNSTTSLCGHAGIAYTTHTDGIIENCFVTLNNSDNIRIDACNSGGISIKNTETSWSGSNAGATNWFAGVWVNLSSNVNIEGLYSHDNSAYGVDWGATDSTYHGNRLTNSSIYYNGNGGIIVGAGAPVVISHNVIKNNGKKSDGVIDSKSNYNPGAIVVNNGKYLTITDNYAIDTVSTWPQIWFIKNWGGGGSTLNTRNNISNNVIRGVADTAHAYNGVNEGTNILLDNQIMTAAGALIAPTSSSNVWTMGSNGQPGWAALGAGSATLTSTYIGYGSGSNLLTGVNKMTYDGQQITLQDSVGTATGTTSVGLWLQSDTATAGATLQNSPAIRFSTTVNGGNGTSYYMLNVPTATNASTFKLYNNAGTTRLFEINQGGAAIFGGPSAPTMQMTGTVAIGGTVPGDAQSLLVLNSAATAASMINGIKASINASNVTATTNVTGIYDSLIMNQGISPSASSFWYGLYGVMTHLAKNGAGARSTIEAEDVGVFGKVNFADTSLALPIATGVKSNINLVLNSGSGPKNITTGYGYYQNVTDANSHLTNIVNLYQYYADSVASNLINTGYYGFYQKGTNATGNFFAANTLVGYNGSTTPNSTLQVTGSVSVGYVAKTANYTLTASDHTVNFTTNTDTATLPTAVGCTGRIYVVKVTANTTAQVKTTSSQTIDGATTYNLASQYKYVAVQSDGANWIVIMNNGIEWWILLAIVPTVLGKRRERFYNSIKQAA